MHSLNIVHCDLTCSHIFINAGTSLTNIGDLWKAAILTPDEQPLTLDPFISSPRVILSEFSAPESTLSSKLDIYSFGMCVLEMITREKPYEQECQGDLSRIRRRALAGVLPASIKRIGHSEASAFIKQCLQHVDVRPTATQLLDHPFLCSGVDDDEQILIGSPTLTPLHTTATSFL